MADEIHIHRTRPPFGMVPDSITTDKSISLQARLVLSYMISRPRGWVINIWHIMRELGISESKWRTIRQELINKGYFEQKRYTDEKGKIRWQNIAYDVKKSTMPSKTTNGETARRESICGQSTDITNELNKLTKQTYKTQGIEAAAATSSRVSKSFKNDNKGLIIENDEDIEKIKLIYKDFDDDEVKNAVDLVKLRKLKPFVSNVLKALKEMRLNNDADISFLLELMDIGGLIENYRTRYSAAKEIEKHLIKAADFLSEANVNLKPIAILLHVIISCASAEPGSKYSFLPYQFSIWTSLEYIEYIIQHSIFDKDEAVDLMRNAVFTRNSIYLSENA